MFYLLPGADFLIFVFPVDSTSFFPQSSSSKLRCVVYSESAFCSWLDPYCVSPRYETGHWLSVRYEITYHRHSTSNDSCNERFIQEPCGRRRHSGRSKTMSCAKFITILHFNRWKGNRIFCCLKKERKKKKNNQLQKGRSNLVTEFLLYSLFYFFCCCFLFNVQTEGNTEWSNSIICWWR